jgi:cysteine desulfurase
MKQNQSIYLDNAATTQMDEQVLQSMIPYLTSLYGNPSSLHSMGRTTRFAIELARKKIASLLGVKRNNIIFTSGGTESNNMAIYTALHDFGCNHIITSRVEHHAVLHTVEHYATQFNIGVSHVKLDEHGAVDQHDFSRLLETETAHGKKCLVSLMHANNETGIFTDIRWISSLCQKYNAIFHCDCVQTIGHYPLNLVTEGIHMASASAHKFHGPKGVGFLYFHEDLHPSPLMFGGGQERGCRAGTENIASIVGMAEALQLSCKYFSERRDLISGLKKILASGLREAFPSVVINSGMNSLYFVLSVSFPKTEETELLLMQLDQKGFCVSGGSACSGGSSSHVMKELGRTDNYETIRFSFGRYNTIAEIERLLSAIKELLPGLISRRSHFLDYN